MRYKKPFVMWIGGLVERLPFLLIALAIWFLGAASPAITLTFSAGDDLVRQWHWHARLV